jgi:hypothetical protein
VLAVTGGARARPCWLSRARPGGLLCEPAGRHRRDYPGAERRYLAPRAGPAGYCDGSRWDRQVIQFAPEQVNTMSTAQVSSASSGRRTLAVVLAIIGILAILAGILYVAGAANSLHFMVGSVHKGHHAVRAAVAFVIGIVLLVCAWFASRRN